MRRRRRKRKVNAIDKSIILPFLICVFYLWSNYLNLTRCSVILTSRFVSILKENILKNGNINEQTIIKKSQKMACSLWKLCNSNLNATVNSSLRGAIRKGHHLRGLPPGIAKSLEQKLEGEYY